MTIGFSHPSKISESKIQNDKNYGKLRWELLDELSSQVHSMSMGVGLFTYKTGGSLEGK